MVFVPNMLNWRIYEDATPDSAMTALEAEETAPTLTYRFINNGTLRIRIRVSETGGTAATNATTTIQYSRDQTTWTDMPAQNTASGEHWLYQDGFGVNGNTISSLLLTSSVTSGKYHEASNTTQTVAANEAGLEMDFSIRCHNATTGTWYFRVSFNGTGVALGSGRSYPQVTITAANRTHVITSLEGDPGAEGLTEDTRLGDQKKMWYDGSKYWCFYTVPSATTSIFYRYWYGTGEWSAASSITGISDTTNQGRFRMWVERIDGVYTVFILAGNNQGTGVTRYLYRGIISGETITWDPEGQISGDFGDEANAIGVDAGGYIWVGGVVNNGGSVWVRRSTNPNDITAFEAALTLTDAGAGESVPFYIAGTTSNKAVLMWYDNTDTDIHASVATSASIGAFTTVNSSTVAHDKDWGYTVDRQRGFVYVAHTNSVTNGGGDVLLQVFTMGADTWSTAPAPPAGSANRPFGGDDHLTIQLLNGHLYLFFSIADTISGEGRRVAYHHYTGGTAGLWDLVCSPISPVKNGNLDRINTLGPGPVSADRILCSACAGDDPNTSSTVDLEWWDENIDKPVPYFVAQGSSSSGTGSISVAWPNPVKPGDIGILVVESANENIVLASAGSGFLFTGITGFPLSTGTAGGTASTRLQLFWRRADRTGMPSPMVVDPTNHAIGQIYVFRNCIDFGSPYEAFSGSTTGLFAGTGITFLTGSASVTGCLIVNVSSNAVDLATGIYKNWRNDQLVGYKMFHHTQATAGNGGGFGMGGGTHTGVGPCGASTAQLNNASVTSFATFALKPKLSYNGRHYPVLVRDAVLTFSPFLNFYSLNGNVGTFLLTGKANVLTKTNLLSLNTGSYAVSGKNAALLKNYLLPLGFTAYVISGKDAVLTEGTALTHYSLPGATGLYLFTGKTGILTKTNLLDLNKGIYTVSGKAANLQKQYILFLNNTFYVVSGKTANLIRTFSTTGNTGVYLISGKANRMTRDVPLFGSVTRYIVTGKQAVLNNSHLLTGNKASYILSGKTAGLARTHIFFADKATYLFTGKRADVIKGYALLGNKATYQFTGKSANVLRQYYLLSNKASYILNGNQAAFARSIVLSANAVPYILSGKAATLFEQTEGVFLIGEKGTYVLTGKDATLFHQRILSLQADKATYTLTGSQASLLSARLLLLNKATYNLTANVASLISARILTLNKATYQLTGKQASTLKNFVLSSDRGPYIFDGKNAGLVAVLGGIILPGATGSYILTGNRANLIYNRLLNGNKAFYTLNGSQASVLSGRTLALNKTTYSLTTNVASLISNRVLTSNNATYRLTGSSASFFRNYVLLSTRGPYIFDGKAAGLTAIVAGIVLPGSPGTYVLTGKTATLVYEQNFVHSPGAYLVAGGQAILKIGNQQMVGANARYQAIGNVAGLKKLTPDSVKRIRLYVDYH